MAEPKQTIPTVPITRCDGCDRSLPLRWTFEGLRELREALEERFMPESTVLATYRCRKCKTVNELTAGDLYLSESGMSTRGA